jgi:hypothetical protein
MLKHYSRTWLVPPIKQEREEDDAAGRRPVTIGRKKRNKIRKGRRHATTPWNDRGRK